MVVVVEKEGGRRTVWAGADGGCGRGGGRLHAPVEDFTLRCCMHDSRFERSSWVQGLIAPRHQAPPLLVDVAAHPPLEVQEEGRPTKVAQRANDAVAADAAASGAATSSSDKRPGRLLHELRDAPRGAID